MVDLPDIIRRCEELKAQLAKAKSVASEYLAIRREFRAIRREFRAANPDNALMFEADLRVSMDRRLRALDELAAKVISSV